MLRYCGTALVALLNTRDTRPQNLLCIDCEHCLWNSDEGHYEVPPSISMSNTDPHVYCELQKTDAGTDTVAPSNDLYYNVSQ